LSSTPDLATETSLENIYLVSCTWPEQRETSRLQQHLSHFECGLSGDLGILGGSNPDQGWERLGWRVL